MANPSFNAKRFAVYAIILVFIVGGRGHLLAHTMGGRYLLSSLLGDVLAFGLVILLIKLVDAGLQRMLVVLFDRLASGRWRRVLVTTCRVVILITVVFPFLLATLQVHPQRIATRGTPAEWDLPYEDVTFSARGRTLHGWFVDHPKAKSVVLVAHGLNANRENFLQPVALLHALGYAAMTFDFPAHGDSPGRSTTLGLLEADDVRAAVVWLRARFPNQPVHALGYSMGASAVLTAAGQDPGLFDKIIVDSTFASLRSVAETTVLRFVGPLEPLMWHNATLCIRLWTGANLNQHNPLHYMANLTPARVMIIHGAADPIIPHSEGVKLYEATDRLAKFRSVEDYGHAETITHPQYATWLGEFLRP